MSAFPGVASARLVADGSCRALRTTEEGIAAHRDYF